MKFPAMSANVTNVNNRKENHGEEHVLAVDVKMDVKGTAQQIIDPFSPVLRKALFQDEEGKEHLLRVAECRSFTWGQEYSESVIELAGKKFEDVKLKGFLFTTSDGGVVTLSFTASFCPDPDDLGELAEHIKEACTMEFVTPIDLVEQQQAEAA